MRTANFAGIIALACSVIAMEYATANAQEMQNAKCSFWMNGNLLGVESCRTRWHNGKVMSINYLAGETPGRGNPETATAWQGGWVLGRNPECLLFKLTGYAICQK